MKKVISLIMVVLLCVGLCACSGASGSSDSNKSITTSTAAINAVKNSDNPFTSAEQRIAGALKFKQFYDPEYGSCTAEQSGDEWQVILKGKMSGYVDEYQSDFKTKKFELKATVTTEGDITIKSVSEIR